MKEEERGNGKIIWVLLIGGLFARLFLAPFGTLRLDMNSWMGWADRLAGLPINQFYNQWSDYLPGYLYILWFLGHIQKIFGSSDLLFKMPGILADVVTGGLIYAVLRKFKVKEKIAVLGAASYLFNPAVFGNSSLWGQVDGLSALVVVVSLVFLVTDHLFWSIFMLGPGFIVKPQTILLFPLVALVTYRRGKLKTLLLSTGALLTTVFFAFIPFWNGDSFLSFIWKRLWLSFNQYPYTSLNAFNLWGLTGGNGWWINDKEQFILGLSYQTFGFCLFLIVFLAVLFRIQKDKKAKPWRMFVGGSILQFLGFFLMTRVHERHLLPALAPLVVAAAGEQSWELFIILGLISLTYVANLSYAYVWITNNYRQIFAPGIISIFSLLNLLALGLLMDHFFRGSRWMEKLLLRLKRLFAERKPTLNFVLPEINFLKFNWRMILVLVVLLAAIGRFWRLGIPNTYMFDEVYHAFTAREMLKGNKAAWEWWNTPPQGFAYEWSHPPLAKELMMTTLSLVNSSLGWRIPGAFLGTLSVILVFTIAWEVFRNRSIAILSAALFSLDTLPLVMSRIGMNDAYFLFFLLLAVWMLLRGNYLLMGVAWGLAVASKWTAIYFLGFVLFVWLASRLWRSTRRTLLLAVSCLLIAPTIYLFSYLPFFTWGHTPAQFNELQHQMWWYHTGLKATHPYQSQWWSWPLTLRPVWIAVDYQNNTIANVYAQGNPLLYWVSILAILTAVGVAIKYRVWSLGVIIVGYGIFFLPWAFSPRIMFIYHYLPSTPFLAILTAWFIVFLWHRGMRKFAGGLFFLIVLAFIFFYPHVTSFTIPNEVDKFFYWFPSWK